jgi:tripeptide aminopeptidase
VHLEGVWESLAVPRHIAPRPEAVSRQPRVARALAWLRSHEDWITEQQIRLTEIPAPPFGEERRARAVADLLGECGWRAAIDEVGNVVAESEQDEARVVLLSAHLDTALAPDGTVHVRRDGTRLRAPGISDNGAGLAALVAVAAAFRATELATRLGVVFAANVGEEGEGNLRGMRALVARYGRRLEAGIAVDGPSTSHITTAGIASRRFEAVISGPGGHSWASAGAPNPIHALGRAIARIVSIPLADNPRTSLNIGAIEGGGAVNAIPARAAMKIDLRSESETELDALENDIRRAVELGAVAERETARSGSLALAVEFRPLGSRPAGRLLSQSPLLAAIREVDRFLGLDSRLQAASTDANIPLSLGIPAIALGGGGTGGGAHTDEEWYDADGRVAGLERILLTLLLVAGLAA